MKEIRRAHEQIAGFIFMLTRRFMVALLLVMMAASLPVASALARSSTGVATPTSSFAGQSSSASPPSSSFTGSGTLGGSGEGSGSEDSGFGDGGGSFGVGLGRVTGMDISAIQRLQSDLARLGFFHHVVTGFYGNVTTAAVERFQRSVGLKPDGIWGPFSAAALRKQLAGA